MEYYSEMRKRLVTILAHLVSLFVVGGCEGDPVVFNIIPEFDYVYSTLHETGIGATLYCGVYIPDDTHIDEYEYGFILNDNNDLSSSSAFKVRATLSDNLSLLTADVNNLVSDKNYYYAAYVAFGRQELLSQTFFFHTGKTQTSINISFEKDVLHSVNVDLSKETVRKAGFCWSTIQEVPTIFDNVINADLKSEGSFSAAIPEDWKQNVQYFVRAYIETADNCIQYSNSISVRKHGDNPAEDEKYIEIEKDLYEIGSAAGIFSTWVSRNVEIQVSSDVDWIEQLSTKAVSTDSLSFLAFRNDTGEKREGHLLLEATDGSVSRTITVIQSGYEEDMNIRFADNVFKSYMVEHFDIDKDGGISEEEAALVEEIETVTDDISSLAGLEYCTNLKKLVCHGSQPGLGQLNALNISKNSVLEYIDCSNNTISSLSVNENKNLKELICANNRLAGLYVNKAQALEVIDCRNNVLEYVDISNLSNLRTLICSKNRMKILNTEQNSDLNYIDCSNNSLNSLNFHNNNKIEYLDCSSNHLTELDLSENSSLSILYCNSNSIKEILVWKNFDKWNDSNFIKDDEATFVDMFQPISIPDPYFKEYLVQNFDADADGEISKNEALSVTSITVYTENITSLQGLEYFTNLNNLSCEIHYNGWDQDGEMSFNNNPVNHGHLSELDLSKNINLRYLSCGGNSISKLDLSHNLQLQTVICRLNSIEELIISKSMSLVYLDCSHNQLTTLDVSNNKALESLHCDGNQIKVLNVSNNTILTSLWCDNNQISMLDVGNNTALRSLHCDDNQIKVLDVSNNVSLKELYCYNNLISSLDINNNKDLESLLCGGNQITALDVNNNTILTTIWCYSNQLTSLNVSNNKALETLLCSGNQLTTLDVANNKALKTLRCESNPDLTELWMANNQQIENLSYDSSITTIKYK